MNFHAMMLAMWHTKPHAGLRGTVSPLVVPPNACTHSIMTIVITLRKFCARKKHRRYLYMHSHKVMHFENHIYGVLKKYPLHTDKKKKTCLFKRFFLHFKSRFCRDLSYLFPFKCAVEILKRLLRKHSRLHCSNKKNIDLSCQKSQISSTMSLKSQPLSSITCVVGENQNIQYERNRVLIIRCII